MIVSALKAMLLIQRSGLGLGWVTRPTPNLDLSGKWELLNEFLQGQGHA